jgi:hypothetical protein
MVFPSSSADYVTNSKRGPTRFLIIFPGRLSLHAPLEATTKMPDETTTLSDNDDLPNTESKEEGDNDDGGDVEETKKTTETKKRTPFAPSQPPQLLGKLLSRSEDGVDHMELRIPFPTHDEAKSDEGDPSSLKGEEKMRTLVMSGRAIPLSGKYIALTFKKTGGAKESGGNVKDKKMGTGSIVCKDVFRSVIVLGDSHLLDEKETTVPLETIATTMRDDDDNAMRHYGGSERTVDGGGGCNGRVKGVRKSLVGSVASMTAVSSNKRKDSVSSKDVDLEESDDVSDDMNVGEDDEDDSSKSDEFVPFVSRKKKSIEEPKKRKLMNESDDDDEVVEMAPAKKRTPRRSVTTAKVSYVDESSDSDGDNSDDTDGSSNNVNEDDEEGDDLLSPTSMPNATKAQSKKAELKKSITTANKNGSIVKRFDLMKDECKPKASSAKKGVTKKDTLAPMKLKNDIIEIDNDDDKVIGNIKFTPTKSHKSESLHAGSSKSPIHHGRRKKNSPLKTDNEPAKRKDIIDLNWDDDPDPFTFM